MTESWLTILHPANFWWLPLSVTVLAFAWMSFEGEARSLPGHIAGAIILMALFVSAVSWLIYGVGSLIWLLAEHA